VDFPRWAISRPRIVVVFPGIWGGDVHIWNGISYNLVAPLTNLTAPSARPIDYNELHGSNLTALNARIQGMGEANRQIERLSRLVDQGHEDDLRHTTVEERWNMMWQLAIDAWAMRGKDVAQQEFQRQVECLKRLGS
jgi:hypothetical protein